MKGQFIALLFASVSFVDAKAQVSVFNPAVTADGVNYILPKTQLQVKVSAIKTVFVPGEYARYADRYLRLSDARSDAETSWRITSVTARTVGEPDTLKRYTVKVKDKNLLPKVQLTRSGLMMAINTNAHEPLADFDVEPDYSTDHRLDYRKYYNEEMLSATSSSKLAELMAQEILDIRDSKNQIKRGQVESMPKDGESFHICLDALDLQEEALMQAFVGYTDTLYCERVYAITPDKDIDKEVLLRFSKKLGYVDSDDLSGEPVYVSITDKHTVTLPTEKEAAKRKLTGLVYNVPSMADVQVFSGSGNYFSGEMPFAQYGTVDVLGPTLFRKDVTTKVVFDTATGGVKVIE